MKRKDAPEADQPTTPPRKQFAHALTWRTRAIMETAEANADTEDDFEDAPIMAAYAGGTPAYSINTPTYYDSMASPARYDTDIEADDTDIEADDTDIEADIDTEAISRSIVYHAIRVVLEQAAQA